MARLMFVLDTHEPTRKMMQTIELACAGRASGSDVVLYLHGDAVYLSDPEKFVRIAQPYQGFDSPKGMVETARELGVQFWLAKRAIDHLGLDVPAGMWAVTAEQMASAWADFDQVITL